jgi:predicted DCC family thiol-disulfide oxidoreductase YuxK
MGTTREVGGVILFDGVCNLCNASVQFVIKRDPDQHFKFASLQSDFAQTVLPKNQADQFNTMVLIRGKKIFLRSSAVLEVARHLKGPWSLLYGLKIIPAFLRDALYDMIARRRYRWFGKSDTCWAPTDDLQARFMDNVVSK